MSEAIFYCSLSNDSLSTPSLIPETKGRSLEDMDIIFGSISAEKRQADIEKHERQGVFCSEPSHDLPPDHG